ncbi:uncharacterized protein LOC111340235 [Stylophora pistillata]|uniref:uncharacterized protein LOC111340235 n=1 Tax=Stylophora pistillata TaxID=50429 RepID=UPI000C0433D9|nr:uncharacterized protein LOC111340235 [Stylophora pistillata]
MRRQHCAFSLTHHERPSGLASTSGKRLTSMKDLNKRCSKSFSDKDGPEFLRLPESEWPREIAPAISKEEEMEYRHEKIVGTVTTPKSEEAINPQRFSKWRRLIRVTAFIQRLARRIRAKHSGGQRQDGPPTLSELQEAETLWLKEAQKSPYRRMQKKEFDALSPFVDNKGVIRVGGRVDNVVVSYDSRHPALLPYGPSISLLITRHMHQCGHGGVASTTAKIRARYWILKASKFAKSVKLKCAFRREMVKVGRNKTAKHYGVIFTWLNTRAVHLGIAVDCSTMEFMQVLRRFFSIRGYPALVRSDNGSQTVGAARELREIIKGFDDNQLREFCAEKGMEWKFTTPASPHENGCAEALVKTCKGALKGAVGEKVLAPLELYTCLLKIANLINQRPIGRIPNDPDGGAYICPNDILLGRVTSQVPQRPFKQTKNPRHRVEFVQRIVESFWKRWKRDVFPTLFPRRKWRIE